MQTTSQSHRLLEPHIYTAVYIDEDVSRNKVSLMFSISYYMTKRHRVKQSQKKKSQCLHFHNMVYKVGWIND